QCSYVRVARAREEQPAAIEDRVASRRAYFSVGKERDFDEDDDFWARGLSNWAEEQGLPTLEEARTLVSGIFPDVAQQISTEDSKRIRELVRNSAIREDRKLAPREVEAVAGSAQQVLEALQPLRTARAGASGSEEGAD